MMTPKLLFILITFCFFSFNKLPKTIRLCIEFESKEKSSFSRIFYQGKIIIIPVKDTCLNLTLVERKNYQISIETPEFVTYLIPIKNDTLSQNQTIYIKALLKNELLKEVTVRPDNAIFMRGDTLIFDVKNIKTKPHGDVNDLLKRIPGIDIGRYGTFDIGGEHVESVTVNGRQIFGGNRQITLDLIRANSISLLEVIKSKSGSGYLDLNIKLKEDHENGLYGDIAYAKGTQQAENQLIKINNITPKSFTNFFINRSNTSENLVSTSLTKQIKNVLSYNEMDKVYSLVSNHFGFFGDLYFKTPLRSIAIPDFKNDRGLNKSLNFGVSQNLTYEKFSFVGFVIAENNKQNLEIESASNNLFGNGLIQNTNQKDNNYSEGWQATSALYAEWNPNKRDKCKLFTSFQHQSSLENQLKLADFQIIKNSQSDSIYNVEKAYFSNKLLNQFTQKFSWIHRHKKKGVITSILATYGKDHYSNYSNYLNQYLRDSVIFNNNYSFGTTPSNTLEFQMAQSIPISNKILLEIKNTFIQENITKDQQTFRYNPVTIQNDFKIPSLSLDSYRIKNNQNDFQINILLKTGRIVFITGLTRWYWKSNREGKEYQKSKILPTLYWQYKFHKDKSRYLSIYMNNNQLLPLNENIFPVSDSSNVYLNTIGNSNLVSFSRWQTGLKLVTNYGILGIYPELKYVIDENPIQFGYLVNTQNQLSQSFVQYGNIKNISGKLYISNARKYQIGFQFSTSVNIYEQNSMFMENIEVVKSFSGNTTFGIKLNPSDKTSFSFNAQNFYNGFFNNKLTTWRNNLDIRTELEFSNRSYLDINCNLNLNKNSSAELINLPIIDFSYSQYILKNNNIKLTIKGNNVLDVRRIFNSFSDLNIQSEVYYSRMPRFLMFSMTYFWEKWRTK
jgi:hypothetical protein